MLKITVEEERNRARRGVRLILEGKLTGPWVAELKKTWNRVNKEPAAVRVARCAVDFISKVGEDLPRKMDRRGAKLGPGNRLMRASETRRVAPSIVLLALFFAGAGYSQHLSLLRQPPDPGGAKLTVSGSAPALAFQRYLASVRDGNSFADAEPIYVEVEASLPSLAKHGSMVAVRQTGSDERSEYSAMKFDGDSIIKQQVIARYLAAEEQAAELPYSSVAVTPANYKFRYMGSMQINGAEVYIFQITPKKKRAGLIQGQIWIDPATGVAVHQAGRLVKRPSVFIRRIEVARDSNLRDGLPSTRVTHVAVDTRMVGRAELTITERPLWTANREAQPLISQGYSQ
jgi:hypothetical protein